MHNEVEGLYTELYETHYEQLLSYIYRRIRDYHEAEDLTEEVFFYLHRKLPQFDQSKAPLAAYLFIIAKSRLKNYYRDKKAFASFDESFMSDAVEDNFDYMEKAIQLMDDRQVIQGLLLQLSERDREIVILKYFGNYRPEEIANVKGISVGNVRVILSRSITKMRKCLNGERSNLRVVLDE